ncbi:MAG TPA: pseudouridine synthase [Chloroflexota bacterium]|nr:pseudouridine synthase [Chloroflexota bacterium]
MPLATGNDTTGPRGEEPVGGDEWRLQKVIARAGVASRRHAEAMILAGRVRVNGRVADRLGTRVDPARDTIEVDGRRVSLAAEHVYLAFNKPSGYVSTANDPAGRPTVMRLVPDVPGLFSVGRLDYESEGLLLFTTDGQWGQRVSHPRHGSDKEYLIEVGGRPKPATLARLRAPMELGDGEWTSGADVRMEGVAPDRALLRIVLGEGRNRQIRRMLGVVGHPVLRLVRVRVGAVHLGDLRPSEWRHLTHAEIATTAGGPVPPEELPLPRGVRRRRTA